MGRVEGVGKGCFQIVKIVICAIPAVGGFLHFLAAYTNLVGEAKYAAFRHQMEGRGQLLIGIACVTATVFLYRGLSSLENKIEGGNEG